MEPCKYEKQITTHDILIQKIDKLMTDNGHDGLPTTVTKLNTQVVTFNANIEVIFLKLDQLSAFMEGEKATKAKTIKRLNWGLAALSVIVAMVSLYLNTTKQSKPQVKEQIQEQKIVDNKNKVKATKDALYKNEIKSQLSNDTIR
jgi:preprotein translocase subunit SecG